MAKPVFTFAIPYYSGREYLTRAIESVLAQDDSSWVAVVADDSHEPDLADHVARVGQGRVHYSKNAKNLGIDGNFNRCLDLAETELVTVLHADDELLPSYARTMRAASARNPNAAAIFCGAEIIGTRGEPQFSLVDYVKRFINPAHAREFTLVGEPGVRALLHANFIVAPTLCFKSSVLGARRFPLGYRFVLDWELTTSLLFDGDSIVGIPDVCYRYRRHTESTTEKLTRSHQRFSEESAFYDRMLEKAKARGWSRCAAIADNRRWSKLHITYRALRSAARLQFRDARDGIKLLRDL